MNQAEETNNEKDRYTPATEDVIIVRSYYGQVEKRSIELELGAPIPDDLLLEGWTEAYRDKTPEILVVVKAGRVRELLSDRRTLVLSVVDLDTAKEAAATERRVAHVRDVRQFYEFTV